MFLIFKEISDEPLSIKTRIGYGAGHICNDITCCIINSYLMLYFQNVIELQTSSVGLISFIGISVGGFISPVIGFLSDLDADNWICNRYGRRKVSLIRKKYFNNIFGFGKRSQHCKLNSYSSYSCGMPQEPFQFFSVSHFFFVLQSTRSNQQLNKTDSLRFTTQYSMSSTTLALSSYKQLTWQCFQN